jgi:hypothetical protein
MNRSGVYHVLNQGAPRRQEDILVGHISTGKIVNVLQSKKSPNSRVA